MFSSIYSQASMRARRGSLHAFFTVLTMVFGVVASHSALAQAIYTDNYIVIDKGGTGSATLYRTDVNPVAPLIQGADLGTYNYTSGVLNFNGASITTSESNGTQVDQTNVYYRVYRPSGTPGPFQPLNIPQFSNTLQANGSRTRIFRNTIAGINLVRAASGVGVFRFELYIQSETSGTGGTSYIRDPSDLNGTDPTAYYQAEFSIYADPTTTIWNGSVDADWFNASNWSAGVPTSSLDAVIPDLAVGNANYPNIYSNAVFPGKSTVNGIAQVNSINFGGSSQSARSIGRLITGELQVYGDFYNPFDSYIQRNGTILRLAGGSQTLTGGSNFDNVIIQGGGSKSMTGTMGIANVLTFISGRLVTGNSPTTNYVELKPPGAATAEGGVAAGGAILGETDASYLEGLVRTERLAPPGTRQAFGNIGMALTFTTQDPGGVLVTRQTGQYYSPALSSAYSIMRIFGVRPGNPNTNTGGLDATLEFKYLDRELSNIGGNSSQNISEPNLALFLSTSSGNTFVNYTRDALDQTTNSLVKNNVTQFATFTLGDVTNPLPGGTLPVELTAFSAKRDGNNALLTWNTASEKNSQGFYVQVSNDGKNFRNAGFVASETPNSSAPRSYRFVDDAAEKSGNYYYRLRQVDTDGKAEYTAVRSLNFGISSTPKAVAASYPNPFQDEVHFTLLNAKAGTMKLRLTDLSGRLVKEQVLNTAAEQSELVLGNLTDLKPGIYMAQLASSTGSTQTMRIQKQ